MNSHRTACVTIAALLLAIGVFGPIAANAQPSPAAWDSGKRQFSATIYGYLPDIGGSLKFPVDSGGASINVNGPMLGVAFRW